MSDNDDHNNDEVAPVNVNGGNDKTDEVNNDNNKFVFRVAVGSKNPCKIDAVKQALQRAIGMSSSLECDLQIEGFDVASGVADQPFGDVSLCLTE